MSERGILPEWVAETIAQPDVLETDPRQPQIQWAFRTIPERGGRVLRVVYLPEQNGARIITVFFDRGRRT